jgi:hypothetical protein
MELGHQHMNLEGDTNTQSLILIPSKTLYIAFISTS